MAYCGPRGIPRSTFLSWPTEDQDAALGWQAYEARRCSSCGYHPAEGSRHTHIDICPGCVVLQRTQKSEQVRERGAVIRMAGGDPGGCDRCRREHGLPPLQD
jgi:hypothetical protein